MQKTKSAKDRSRIRKIIYDYLKAVDLVLEATDRMKIARKKLQAEAKRERRANANV